MFTAEASGELNAGAEPAARARGANAAIRLKPRPIVSIYPEHENGLVSFKEPRDIREGRGFTLKVAALTPKLWALTPIDYRSPPAPLRYSTSPDP
ncbi:hypothetical protein EVAR_28609_1 [Eumeta japonica]|uniref:Uncharacterized protein n=1 Tax=Eumeta variegata TaxID=151549 RepID=A0A4C1XUV1_EUMVA|nr:hypothetical protein EVAR_28609_1 [Eumeta japonica]